MIKKFALIIGFLLLIGLPYYVVNDYDDNAISYCYRENIVSEINTQHMKYFAVTGMKESCRIETIKEFIERNYFQRVVM